MADTNAKVRVKRAEETGKILGKDVLCYLNYGTGATYDKPVWALFGAQTSGDYDESADSIDATDKNSGGYGETLTGNISSELDLECIRSKNNDAIEQLRKAMHAHEQVDIVRFNKTDGTAIRNWYSLTDFKESAPHDDLATVSITLNGCGKPLRYSGLTTVDDIATATPESDDAAAGSTLVTKSTQGA